MASTPDEIATAFCLTLTPGGTMNAQGQCVGGAPVGGVGIFVKRTPDAPYQGPLPIVQVKPFQNIHGRAAAAGGFTLGKVDRGWMILVYRDAPPSQQAATTPGRALYQIEDAMVAARNGITAYLDQHNTLDGAVTIAAEENEELYQLEPFEEWQNAEFVGWAIKIPYIGTLPT